ncbi:MAG: hypothetical protein AB1485_06005, partial [Candidatus Thermoplasmatota archaeon]
MSKKLWSIIILVIVIISAIIAYWVSRRKVEEQILKVEDGDIVSVNYTIWVNETGTWSFFNTSTVNFTVGLGANIEGVVLEIDSKILNMTIGQTKEFVLEPWEAFKNWSWLNVRNISVIEKVPKFEYTTKAEFARRSAEPIAENVVFTHWIWNWNSTIIDVEGENITIEHLRGVPAQNTSYIGLVIQSTKYDWNSTVINISGDEILLRHEAVKCMNTRVIGKGKVLDITNQTEPSE